MPAFSILFLPMLKVLRFFVNFNPSAISLTPKVPSPQLEMSKTFKFSAPFKKVRRALAPYGLTALLLISNFYNLVARRPPLMCSID